LSWQSLDQLLASALPAQPLQIPARRGIADDNLVSQFQHQAVALIAGFFRCMGDAVGLTGDDQQAVVVKGCLDLRWPFLHHATGQGKDNRLGAFQQIVEYVFLDTGMKAGDDTGAFSRCSMAQSKDLRTTAAGHLREQRKATLCSISRS